MGNDTDEITRLLGDNIRNRRKQLGLTQEQLAESIGIGHQALSRIEQGIMAPKMSRLATFAKSLHCAVPELFRYPENTEDNLGRQINELVQGLSHEKQVFIYKHIAQLVFFLKEG